MHDPFFSSFRAEICSRTILKREPERARAQDLSDFGGGFSAQAFVAEPADLGHNNLGSWASIDER